MGDRVPILDSPAQVAQAAQRLRLRTLRWEWDPNGTIDALERWGAKLQGAAVEAIPGVPFLKLWLRRGTLQPLLERELGPEALQRQWLQEGGARLRAFPLGVIGHWPAGNI